MTTGSPIGHPLQQFKYFQSSQFHWNITLLSTLIFSNLLAVLCLLPIRQVSNSLSVTHTHLLLCVKECLLCFAGSVPETNRVVRVARRLDCFHFKIISGTLDKRHPTSFVPIVESVAEELASPVTFGQAWNNLQVIPHTWVLGGLVQDSKELPFIPCITLKRTTGAGLVNYDTRGRQSKYKRPEIRLERRTQGCGCNQEGAIAGTEGTSQSRTHRSCFWALLGFGAWIDSVSKRNRIQKYCSCPYIPGFGVLK